MLAAESHRSRLALAALVAALVVCAAWWVGDLGPRDGRAAAERDVPTVMLGVAALDVAAEGVELAAADSAPVAPRTALPSTATRVEPGAITSSRSTGSRARPEPFGRLAIRAIDATSGRRIRAPRVRAASPTRFAEWTGVTIGTETQLRLTPGDYALSVTSPGYEPAEVRYASVVASELTTLEPVSLRPGSGRIVGRADGVRSDEVLHVELRGEGRLACGKCTGLRCTSCGWALEDTRLALAPDGAFAFERLASGAYLLRIVDESEREAGAPIRIDLMVGETRSVEIPVARPRTVFVALVDIDGTQLDRVWSDRKAGAVVGPEVEVVADGEGFVQFSPWSCRFLEGGVLVAQGEFTPPSPPGVTFVSPLRPTNCRFPRTRERDDRERRADDELRPTPAVPSLEPAQLAPRVDESGFVRFHDVPARVQVLEMSCGAFTAVVPIDDGVFDVLRAQIGRDPWASPGTASYLAFESGRDD